MLICYKKERRRKKKKKNPTKQIEIERERERERGKMLTSRSSALSVTQRRKKTRQYVNTKESNTPLSDSSAAARRPAIRP
jgi:hypothetical protein